MCVCVCSYVCTYVCDMEDEYLFAPYAPFPVKEARVCMCVCVCMYVRMHVCVCIHGGQVPL